MSGFICFYTCLHYLSTQIVSFVVDASNLCLILSKIEDVKRIIRNHKWYKDREYNWQKEKKMDKLMIYKSLHRKQEKTEQHDPNRTNNENTGINSGGQER